jgi:hypothetical protein
MTTGAWTVLVVYAAHALGRRGIAADTQCSHQQHPGGADRSPATTRGGCHSSRSDFGGRRRTRLLRAERRECIAKRCHALKTSRGILLETPEQHSFKLRREIRPQRARAERGAVQNRVDHRVHRHRGVVPASSSKSVAPSAHTSVRASTRAGAAMRARAYTLAGRFSLSRCRWGVPRRVRCAVVLVHPGSMRRATFCFVASVL